MIPLAAAVVLAMVCGILGYFIRTWVYRYQHRQELSEFNAYSDKELASQRKLMADKIRYRLAHGYNHITRGPIARLAKIDREIARRDKEKDRQLALSASKMSQTMQELAAFDVVFTALDSGQKEKK